MSPKMNRRRFLAATAAAAAATSLRSFAQAPAVAKISLHPDQILAEVPANFIGVSYETQQLADPNFFSTSNKGLLEQFRALTPHGVLRIGGNTSDVGWWKATPESEHPPLPANVVLRTPPGEKSPMDLAYAVTPESTHNLRAFLDATGWTCLYGINLGSSTPARAAEEAEFVFKVLGPKLEYFQVSNEPDGFPNRFRDREKWSADAYFDDWIASVNAIRERVPDAKFGLPDVAGHPDWTTTVANRLAALPEGTRPQVAALSHHHYFTGPPSNPKANFDDLLKPDAGVLKAATTVSAAAAKIHTRYRMTEGNTCYRGGKPGFSDCFGAALWAADYALLLGSLGYAGVNFHGGSGKAVADSLGGTLPGELLMPDPKAPHPRPFYTPIAEIDGHYVAEPISFGMKFAASFAGGKICKLDFDAAGVNATAYAAILPNGQQAIAIINKDAKPLPIDLKGFVPAWTLSAPALKSKTVELRESKQNYGLTEIPAITAVLLKKA